MVEGFIVTDKHLEQCFSHLCSEYSVINLEDSNQLAKQILWRTMAIELGLPYSPIEYIDEMYQICEVDQPDLSNPQVRQLISIVDDFIDRRNANI